MKWNTAHFCVLLPLFACDNGDPLTETGNPEMEGRLQVSARTSNEDAVALEPESPAMVSVTHADIGLERLRLYQGQGCATAGGANAEIPVPDSVPLVDPGEPLGFTAEEGNYCRLRLHFSAADALDDQVWSVLGERNDGTPFTVTSRHVKPLELRNDEAFAVSAENADFVLGFDAARWFAEVDLNEAEVVGDEILINEDSNVSFLNTIEAGFDKSLDLFADTNANGVLEEDEADTVLATSDEP